MPGLSPRGRGKPPPHPRVGRRPGSIPAWAGETSAVSLSAGCSAVYPRVGGGNAVTLGVDNGQRGLSPRGRGKHFRPTDDVLGGGSIPAWAGETAYPDLAGWLTGVYPRVGGGNRGNRGTCSISKGLSPRGRGKLYYTGAGPAFVRSIPAWAGETTPANGGNIPCRVYPRVGGGNPGRSPGNIRLSGLSPRGRGKPCPRPRPHTYNRSIPAWAGETLLSPPCAERE